MLATLQTALNDGGERYEAEQLEKVLPSITHYLIDDAKRGWFFQADAKGRTCAYLITRLDYTPPGEEEAGRILIELKANSKGKIAIETLIIRAKDIAGQNHPRDFCRQRLS